MDCGFGDTRPTPTFRGRPALRTDGVHVGRRGRRVLRGRRRGDAGRGARGRPAAAAAEPRLRRGRRAAAAGNRRRRLGDLPRHAQSLPGAGILQPRYTERDARFSLFNVKQIAFCSKGTFCSTPSWLFVTDSKISLPQPLRVVCKNCDSRTVV